MLRLRIAAADADGGSSDGGCAAATLFLTACCHTVLSFDSAGGFSMTSAAPRSSPIQTALRAAAPGSASRMSGRCLLAAQSAAAAGGGPCEGAWASKREDWGVSSFGIFG